MYYTEYYTEIALFIISSFFIKILSDIIVDVKKVNMRLFEMGIYINEELIKTNNINTETLNVLNTNLVDILDLHNNQIKKLQSNETENINLDNLIQLI